MIQIKYEDLTYHKYTISNLYFFLEDFLISLYNKKQTVIDRSRIEIKYHAIIDTITKSLWLH